MRVLLVLATSGGGVGRHVAQLARGLSALPGHEVRVVGPVETERVFGFGAAGAEFEPLDVADRPRPLADRRAVERLRELAVGCDVVHAHGLRAGALAVLAVRLPNLRGAIRRPKVVVTLHNAVVSGGPIAAVYAVLEQIVARGADVVLAVSADLRKAIVRRGARDVRPAVVPAPVPAAPLRSAEEVRRALGVPPGGALLVTIARLAPQKGLFVLLEAVGQLSEGGVSVHAVVAGEGPLRPRLAASAVARGLPLRLLGRRDDVPDLLAAADLVVVPSLWEGQPLTVQEALLAGAAIVATDAGGTAAVAGDGAVLVKPSSPASLAGAIADLIGDPAGIAELRRRALARGRALPTEQDALRQVVSVYETVTRPA